MPTILTYKQEKVSVYDQNHAILVPKDPGIKRPKSDMEFRYQATVSVTKLENNF